MLALHARVAAPLPATVAPLGALLFDLWLPAGLSAEETRDLLDLVLFLDEKNRLISETYSKQKARSKAPTKPPTQRRR